MIRCRIPKLCERYAIDVGINVFKSKPKFPRSGNQRNVFSTFNKKPILVFGEKNRKESLLNAVDERQKKFNYLKNKINDYNLSQRVR